MRTEIFVGCTKLETDVVEIKVVVIPRVDNLRGPLKTQRHIKYLY